jgi:hypothetical protein
MIDLTGMKIPLRLESLWSRRDEVIETMRYVQVMRKSISMVWQQDPLYLPVSLSSIASKLESVYKDLMCAVPYAVCSSCQGAETDSCVMCKGRGFLSKLQWDVCVPEEMKAIRKAMKC